MRTLEHKRGHWISDNFTHYYSAAVTQKARLPFVAKGIIKEKTLTVISKKSSSWGESRTTQFSWRFWVMVTHLSSILVLALSSFSRICGSWVSSSHADPQPNTRARSFPVPKGSTPSWHCVREKETKTEIQMGKKKSHNQPQTATGNMTDSL